MTSSGSDSLPDCEMNISPGPPRKVLKLKQKLEALEKENAALKADVVTMRSAMHTLNQRIKLYKDSNHVCQKEYRVEDLPYEILLRIFNFLGAKEVCQSARLVCRAWAEAGEDEWLWEMLVKRHHRPPADLNKPDGKTWKWTFRSQHMPPIELGYAVYPDGSKYYGEFVNKVEEGYGIKFWPIEVLVQEEGREPRREIKHDKYDGYWENGIQHGVGCYTWVDGSLYNGDWNKGRRCGEGIYLWPNKSNYIGEWKDGRQDGKGTYTWVSGSVYMGHWENGAQTKWGLKKWGDSSQYEGDWDRGCKEGPGIYKWIDGREYNGEWKNGKKHGYGQYMWADGSTYWGQWESGFRNGTGLMRWSDGSSFHGRWHKDRRLRDGEVGPETVFLPRNYEKLYDFYFVEDDELWEQKYRSNIDAGALAGKTQADEAKRKRRDLKRQRKAIQKRFKINNL